MQISITITDADSIADIKAVGANDLLEYFLPKAGIRAEKVKLSEITDDNLKLRASGKEYKHYLEEATA